MQILLITPSNAGGHHNEYKALLTKAFIDLGHEVLHYSQKRSTNLYQHLPGNQNIFLIFILSIKSME
jgi:hypothetical protein